MNLKFVLSEVSTGLRKNLSMVVSVILVTFVSLTFVGTAGLLQMQINTMKNYWYDKAQVAIYLCTNTSPDTVCPQGEASPDVQKTIAAKLEGATLKPFIKKYYFENHQQAYQTFQQQFKGNVVAKYVQPAQLNETFWISLNNPNQSAVITESFSGVTGVEQVKDQRTYLDQIFSILNIASLAAVGIAVLMLFSATLLVSTTIRLSAVMRRREIGIMRLVGASNFYIRLPFVIEGVVAGLIGAALAGGAVFAIVQYFVQGYLVNQLPLTSFVGLGDAATILPLLIGAGVVLTAIASNQAIRRYLKV